MWLTESKKLPSCGSVLTHKNWDKKFQTRQGGVTAREVRTYLKKSLQLQFSKVLWEFSEKSLRCAGWEKVEEYNFFLRLLLCVTEGYLMWAAGQEARVFEGCIPFLISGIRSEFSNHLSTAYVLLWLKKESTRQSKNCKN